MAIVIDAQINIPRTAQAALNRIDARTLAIQNNVKGINREMLTLVKLSGQAAKNFQSIANSTGKASSGVSGSAKSSSSGGGTTSGVSGSAKSSSSGGGTTKKPPFMFDKDPIAGMKYYAAAAAAGDIDAGRLFSRYKNMASRNSRNAAHAQMFQNVQGNPAAALVSDVFARTRFGKKTAQVLGVDLMRLIQGGQGGLAASMVGGTQTASTAASAGSAAGAGGGFAGSAAGAGGGFASSAAGAGGGLAALAEAAEAASLFLAEMGPIGWAVLGGLVALTEAAAGLAVALVGASKAAEYYGAAGKYNVLNGGNGTESYRARLLDSLGDFTGAAHNTNPIVAGMAGISPITGPFGDMNYSARSGKIFDLIRRQKSLESARRIAALAGDPSLANAYLVDNDTAKMLRNQPLGPSQYGQRVAASYNAQKDMVGENLQRIEAQILMPLMAGLLPLLKGTNKVLEEIGTFLQWLDQKLGLDVADKKKDKFGEAVDQFGNYVNQLPGVYGGGARTNRAATQGVKGNVPGYAHDRLGVM